MIPGIHVSTVGGIHEAPGRLRELGLSAGQIFTANQRRWVSPRIPPEKVEQFRENAEGLIFVSHASYLINPSSSRKDVRDKSRNALKEETDRCRILGIPFLVVHPGSYQDSGLKAGMKFVADAVADAVSGYEDGPMILLENTAGAGTSIGRWFKELAEIKRLSGIPEKIGFCIDTAHAHGAGYDLNEPGFIKEICSILGAENVKVFHMNGSKVERGSLRDRHEHFSAGTLRTEVLKALYDNGLFEYSLGIAETPGTDDERAADIRMLTQ